MDRISHKSFKHFLKPPAQSPASKGRMLIDFLRSAYRWALDEAAIRQSIGELQKLDDHTLADIGVERFEIESLVRKRQKARGVTPEPDLGSGS